MDAFHAFFCRDNDLLFPDIAAAKRHSGKTGNFAFSYQNVSGDKTAASVQKRLLRFIERFRNFYL